MRNFSIKTIVCMILMSISYGGLEFDKVCQVFEQIDYASYFGPREILQIASTNRTFLSFQTQVIPALCQHITTYSNTELPTKMDQIFHNLNAVYDRKYFSTLGYIDDFKRGLPECKRIYSEPVFTALSDLNHEVAELSCSFHNLVQNQLHDNVLLRINRMDQRNIQERDELLSKISKIQKEMSGLSDSWQNMSSKHNIEQLFNQMSNELQGCGGLDRDSMKDYQDVQGSLKDMALFIQEVYAVSSAYKGCLLDQPVSSVVPLVDDSGEN